MFNLNVKNALFFLMLMSSSLISACTGSLRDTYHAWQAEVSSLHKIITNKVKIDSIEIKYPNENIGESYTPSLLLFDVKQYQSMHYLSVSKYYFIYPCDKES